MLSLDLRDARIAWLPPMVLRRVKWSLELIQTCTCLVLRDGGRDFVELDIAGRLRRARDAMTAVLGLVSTGARGAHAYISTPSEDMVVQIQEQVGTPGHLKARPFRAGARSWS